MDSTIKLELGKEDIKKLLRNNLTGPNKEVLVNIIYELCAYHTQSGEMVTKACLGIAFECKFKVGDKVYVDVDYISNYKWDKVKMKEQGLIFANNLMLATITKTNPYKTEPYEIKYSVLREGDDNIIVQTYDVKERILTPYEDILDQ